MAPGRTSSRISSPAWAPPLPQVSFRKIEDESDVNEPAGVTDPTSRSYGYNDFSFFTRPEHYIRYIEPMESEVTNQVEYDMDEQDQEWLDLVNEDRKKAQVGPVSSEIFEIMMDRLEKEWFELMKRVPKPDIGLPSEDSTCAICDDGEGENSNAIVFCDGCNLAVHQDCYGVPYIPEGQWLCRKCTVSPEIPVPCVFCPNEGGAFKQTSTGQWAHLLCAMFIPEVTVGNTMFMEPIDNVDKVPKSRWKLTCSLCKIKHGACIQCDKTTCFAAFHVTCARRAKLLMGMKGLTGEEASFKGYCEKHLPEDVRKTRGDVADVFEGPLTVPARTPKSSKSARAYSKKYSLGPPLVPQLIADKLETYHKKHFRQKAQFVQLICKYWSLKREARRGAPLLKRLHLEPWIASTVTKQQTDQEKALKFQYLVNLRDDLEKVRTLTELTRKREQQKLTQAQLLKDIILNFLFPHAPVIRHALDQIQLLDKNEIFLRPVTRAEAPDYFDIVKNPMSFMGIEAKLDKGEYLDFESFKSDINLVFDNAMMYNKRDTVFHKTAARLKALAAHTLGSLTTFPVPGTNSEDPSKFCESGPVGDLEADPEVLKLLLSEDNIKDETDLFIGTEPVTSLFRFEREKFKPPPPPLPLRPKFSKSKAKRERPKRDYKLERERRRQAQAALAAENALLLDSSPGFRAPRATRSTRAALAAIEAELVAVSTQSPSIDVVSGTLTRNEITLISEVQKANGSETAKIADHPVKSRDDRTLLQMPKAGESETAVAGHSEWPKVDLTLPSQEPKANGSENAEVTHHPMGNILDAQGLRASGSDNAEVADHLMSDPTLPSEGKTSGYGTAEVTDHINRPKDDDLILPSQPKPSGVQAIVADHIEWPNVHPRPRSWRREHVLLPGQGAPNMVESMDNQGSFKNFDRGWILPSGSRRHGRAVPEPQPTRDLLPPPRKRARPEIEKSRLSIVSSEPVDDSAIRHIMPPDGPGSETPKQPMDEPSGHSHQPSIFDVPPEYFSSIRVTRSTITAVESSGSRTVPPTETEAVSHDVKRKRSRSFASASGEPEMSAGSSRVPESQQSLASKRSHKKGANNMSSLVPKSKAPGPKQGMITLQEGESLLGGTLVWAKMESYPWWAAVVWEEDPKDVPMNVLRSKRSIPRSEPGPLTLVQFYDKARSWQWLELSSLRLLGEDKELDLLLLSGRGKVQTFRTPRLRQGCRQAYKQAIAEMEGPEEETNDGFTNHSVEATASVEPVVHNPPSEMPSPVAQSLPEAGPSHLIQPPSPPRLLIMPTSRFTAMKPQRPLEQDVKEEQTPDYSIKLDEFKLLKPNPPVGNNTSFL